ncbi:hypothetical protein AC579_2777 [Pseudocercospora musae]|uniref:Zn(2)-C6 fungal-type domain-containing protein n=1 Tax=Pseudocercospora musae TaxID=113226 RepID=A0A139II19_9PEZI|nr:hypothetical protein AC579_2777 [Pseudocercospora musae]
MPEARDESPGDDYFNDLSQQPSQQNETETNGERRNSQEAENEQVPKPKRIACVLCRKRKLRCDGVKPACGTCTRLGHDCSYDEVRRKSGPKRGYVKALEARLAQVETLLKTQDESSTTSNKDVPTRQRSNGRAADTVTASGAGVHMNMAPHMANGRAQQDMLGQSDFSLSGLGLGASGEHTTPEDEPFPWEMIGLGLDEPLPTQDVVNELNTIYFEKVHPSLPMIHRPRYYAAMNLAPHMRPPICLRYAMWANAAAVSDKYDGLQEHFYQRARKYIQQDEMKGHGESMITVAHCQTWALLATHEFKLMYFPRAWMSAGRACRMSQMMGLHRLDGTGLDVKQCLPPPKDWTEREERRRTFWMCFCVDRYSSIGTGWPMTIEEKDIMTSLPVEEDAFELSRPTKTMSLIDSLDPSGPQNLSSFAGVILMACLFGRNLTHLHRPSPDDHDDDLNGAFWKRHRSMDNILLHTALALPEALRLPSGLNSPNTVFMNMNIHTSTICLHQAAIFKADKNRMPARISAESKVRCITAAAEIASIMRQISHLDLCAMNPFISFCLYVAARVFVQYLKSRPKDAQVKASLQFLLSAMHAIKRKNPLTESFLVQLDVDLEGARLEDSAQLRSQMKSMSSTSPHRSPGCPMSEYLGMGRVASTSTPTYGDSGLATYNVPHQQTNDLSAAPTTAQSGGGCMSQFELPNRQRTGGTPGSVNSTGMYQSPHNTGPFNPEMDTSPDASGDQRTPNSSTNSHSNHNPSSHTSNTGYSPQNQHFQDVSTGSMMDASAFATMLDPGDPGLSADFDMNAFPASSVDQQQPGFVLPQMWTGMGSTGMTPGPTGMTPAASNGVTAGMNDMMASTTDADWNQMMESFSASGWDAGLEHNHSIQEVMGGRGL